MFGAQIPPFMIIQRGFISFGCLLVKPSLGVWPQGRCEVRMGDGLFESL